MDRNGEPRDPGTDPTPGSAHPSIQPTSADGAADPAGPPALEPDAVLAGRFRIRRFVARGGMGELYEAEDLELHERVALKTILPAIAARPNTLERFRREVHLARRVTHPNVCRTYDLFHHREGDGDIVFVTMEFLEGETLADLLRRRKHLTPAEALPIAQQVAGALSAAHDAGVVHRDLKAGNVLLVPGESDGRMRAVVTDFGLAVPAREELGSGSLTATGHFVGTPAYMAPEQVEGKPITQATDVYAFGILLYEMMTGALPFEGGSLLAVAARRLNTDAPSPRSLRPDLDPIWEGVIVRCMKRQPEERFSSVAEVSRALTDGTLPKIRGKARKRTILAWAIGAAAVLAIAYALIATRKPAPGSPPAGAGAAGGPRPAVAVLGFRNLSGKPEVAWLSTAFSEMLTTELGAGGKLRTIPGETVARMKVDLGLPDADSYATDTLARVRSNLGSDAVVFGSFFASGSGPSGKIRIDLRVQGSASAEAVQVASEEGTEEELLDLVARAGSKLRESLSAGDVSSAELAGTRAALPGSSEAARLYAEGLSRLRLYDGVAARDLLTRAVAADPKSALAHSALSAAWSFLGYDKTAAEEAEKAIALSEGLPRESRLMIEGRFHEASRDWPKAIETYKTLFGFFPDNFEHGMKLAAVQVVADAPGALETLGALRKMPKPASDDPRIDYLEARVEDGLGDFRRCLELARKVTERAKAIGARTLAAQGLILQWNALGHLGEPDEAWKAATEAREISSAAGDRRGVALALNTMANSRRSQGDLQGATDLFRQALAIDREIGNQTAVSNDLNSLANVLVDLRDYEGAMKAYQDALTIRREVRSVRGIAGSLGNIANLLQYRGDLQGSRRLHDESLEIHRQLQDERGVSIELNNIAILLSLEGKYAEAQARFDEALGIKRRLGHKSSVAFSLTALGELETYEGDLAAAKKHLEEALAIRKELGEEGNLVDTQTDLAQIAVEEGRIDEAIRVNSESAAALVASKETVREGMVRTQLALALLAKRDVAGARREIESARRLLHEVDDPTVRLPLGIAGVRVGIAAGSRAPLRPEIDRVVTEADRSGIVVLQLEARMARAELLAAMGAKSDAQAAAREVETRAKTLGIGLLARHAEAFLK